MLYLLWLVPAGDRASADAHQLILQVGGELLFGVILGLVIRIRHSVIGYRVGSQELRDIVACAVTAGALQSLEHISHSSWVHAGLIQCINTDSVSFCFSFAGILEGLVLCQPTASGQCRKRSIPTGSCCKNDPGQQTGNVNGCAFFALGHSSGEVALTQVSQFVGEDRRHFMFRLRVAEQAVVNTNYPARRRESVQRLIPDNHNVESAIFKLAV